MQVQRPPRAAGRCGGGAGLPGASKCGGHPRLQGTGKRIVLAWVRVCERERAGVRLRVGAWIRCRGSRAHVGAHGNDAAGHRDAKRHYAPSNEGLRPVT